MNKNNSYLEDKDSQLPAILLLQQLGYTYISTEEALELRDGLLTRFFHFTQMLIATSVNELFYATAGTPKKFWSVWREEEEIDETVKELISKPDTDTKWVNRLREHYHEKPQFKEKSRQPTKQDLNLYSLCRPSLLLELTRNFTVFDNNTRKIARYQQYFRVKRMMNRVRHTDDEGNRKGGVIFGNK